MPGNAPKHVHRYIVRHLNGEPEPFHETDKAGRSYRWRISVCEGCGTWYSEGAYGAFPEHPAIGEVLRSVIPDAEETDLTLRGEHD